MYDMLAICGDNGRLNDDSTYGRDTYLRHCSLVPPLRLDCVAWGLLVAQTIRRQNAFEMC